MKIPPVVSRAVVPALFAVAVVGCGSIPSVDKILPDRKVEYKKSKQTERSLEIPPDLSRSTIQDELVIPGESGSFATLSRFEQTRPAVGRGNSRPEVLPEVKGVRVFRDGDERWLIISSAPEDVWYRVVDFWQENGVLLEEQDPTVGIILTDWLENTADIKNDFITDFLRSAVGGLMSASTRDQFRVRIENGDQPETTELYLTHRGMQETIVQDGQGQVERTVWNPRPTDHGLEAEMLRRLMVYLGVEDQQARRSLAADRVEKKPRARLNKSGDSVSVTVDETFDRAWRLVGVALDRVGFAVEDRNRNAGVYYVRYNDPMKHAAEKGWLSKLAFWQGNDENIDKENQYQVELVGKAEATDIMIRSQQGVPDNSDTAQRILTLLQEQLQ
ncbi:MAG: outer membrane protein assembly factor BamC [Gammaproteobacteria bacterium]|nr:outer membrane protein assembly factor BamC [Gammaproteobacteria bacterium]